jgi:hypothetical protein
MSICRDRRRSLRQGIALGLFGIGLLASLTLPGPQVVERAVVERLELGRCVVGKLKLAFDLLGSDFVEIFVDDVADVFQIDRERDDFHGAPAPTFVQAATCELGDIELNRLVKMVDDIVHA